MSTQVAVYLQDAHAVREGMEIARYAESKGFHAIWQAESRLVREATVPMAAFLAVTERIKVGSGCGEQLDAEPGAARIDLLDLGRPRSGPSDPGDRRLVGATGEQGGRESDQAPARDA